MFVTQAHYSYFCNNEKYLKLNLLAYFRGACMDGEALPGSPGRDIAIYLKMVLRSVADTFFISRIFDEQLNCTTYHRQPPDPIHIVCCVRQSLARPFTVAQFIMDENQV